jgi:ketosteroid isomerase-like protein
MAVSGSPPGAVLELRDFVERYLDAWNSCDTDAMAQLITDDIVWAGPALPETARGVPAVQHLRFSSSSPAPTTTLPQRRKIV